MAPTPHPFSLRQLQYALAVAELGSFRRAADACHVAQPSLSAQVATLETALGVVLFERQRRGVLVTSSGQAVLERMRQVVAMADDLADAARAATDPWSGDLAIGVIPTVSPYALPLVVAPLRAELPKLSLRWIEDRTPALVAALQAGRIEGALLALEAELGDVEARPVMKDHFVLALPRDHALARSPRPVKLAELADLPVLLLEDGHCLRDQALSLCQTAHAQTLELTATSMPTLVQMAASGLGITLLPELALTTENRLGALVTRPFSRPRPFRTLGLVWRKRSPRTATLRRIAGIIEAALAKSLGLGHGAPS